MTNQGKIKDVLAGKELLRINSQHKQLPNQKKKWRLVAISITYGLGMLFSLWFYWGESPLIYLTPAIITALYCFCLILFFSFTSNKGNPLIFTEKGIVLPNITANYWNEIESYGWEDYTGWNKVPGPRVFSASGGITLHVNLSGTMAELFSGWRATRGGNILATYLIFFSPEQIAQAESVFSEFGVQRPRQQSAADGLR